MGPKKKINPPDTMPHMGQKSLVRFGSQNFYARFSINLFYTYLITHYSQKPPSKHKPNRVDVKVYLTNPIHANITQHQKSKTKVPFVFQHCTCEQDENTKITQDNKINCSNKSPQKSSIVATKKKKKSPLFPAL